ncbi:hypothetical protein ES703_25607 [subsurface metagenome]
MKNVILSLVVVAVLVAGGVGGVFAGFSDSEISQDNVILTGSLDLKVNGADDLPWGTGVGPKVVIEHMTPSKVYHFQIEVRNDGQCEIEPDLYIHFKNFVCSNVPPEHDGIIGPDGGLKPEPELVAEYGGLVDQRWVEGPGQPVGDDCSMASHIDVAISYGPLGGPMEEVVSPTKMWFLDSEQIYLGKLPPCGETYIITLALHLQQIEDTEVWPAKDDPNDIGLVPEKFKYWPTNALMKDQIMFDIEFDLLQVDP